MDYLHKEIAFRKITSNGEGRIYCSQPIGEVIKDGQMYAKWNDTQIITTDGSHEYVIILKGGGFIRPMYP